MAFDQLTARMGDRFGTDTFTTETFRDNSRLILQPEQVFPILKWLKEDAGFDMLIDITAADYLHYPDAKDRFGVIYCLLNLATGERLVVKTFVNDPEPKLPTVYYLWRGADWLEREVFDMYGISFDGHPNLKRLLMPPEFESYPLRKDYPLRGKGERHNFPVLTRAES